VDDTQGGMEKAWVDVRSEKWGTPAFFLLEHDIT